MTTIDHLSAIEHDGRLFAEVVAGNFGATVLACPGWDVGDLVWHLREVHAFWARIVAERLSGPPGARPQRPDDPDQLLADYTQGLSFLVQTLRAVYPAAPCWTWAPQKDCAFVFRAPRERSREEPPPPVVGERGRLPSRIRLRGRSRSSACC